MASAALEKFKVLAEGLVPSEEKKPAAPAENQPEWAGHVAVLTGILAALAAFLTVRATQLTNDAIYESNQAVLAQTEASDAWAQYQADSIKARIVEVQLLASSALNTGDKKKLRGEDEELRTRQPKIKQDAQDKENQRQDHLGKSLSRLGQRDLLSYAGMAAQLGIALASVAALTHRRQIFYIGIAVGVASILLTGYTVTSGYLAGH